MTTPFFHSLSMAVERKMNALLASSEVLISRRSRSKFSTCVSLHEFRKVIFHKASIFSPESGYHVGDRDKFEFAGATYTVLNANKC